MAYRYPLEPVDDPSRLSAMDKLSVLQEKLGYSFKRPELLQRALTHSSSEAVVRGQTLSYERLEFLGDRVLGLVIADYLWQKYSREDQGFLSRHLTQLVRGETCALVSRKLDLGQFMSLGDGEASSGGRQKEALLADVCESVIAALYVDGGIDVARDFILSQWKGFLDGSEELIKDPKTALQEWSQARGLGTPRYVEVEREGPDHAPIFTIEVRIDGVTKRRAKGASKREAQQAAARQLLIHEGVWQK